MASSVSYDISELWVGQVTADTAPSTYTVNTLVQVPGVRTMNLTWEMVSDELRGDGGVYARVGYLDKVNGSITALFSAAVMAEIFNADVSTSGQDIVTHFTGGGGGCAQGFPYFYIEGAACHQGQDIHPALWKAQVTGASLNFNEQSFTEFTMEFSAIPTQAEFEIDAGPPSVTIPMLMTIWQNGVAVPVTDPGGLGLLS